MLKTKQKYVEKMGIYKDKNQHMAKKKAHALYKELESNGS